MGNEIGAAAASSAGHAMSGVAGASEIAAVHGTSTQPHACPDAAVSPQRSHVALSCLLQRHAAGETLSVRATVAAPAGVRDTANADVSAAIVAYRAPGLGRRPGWTSRVTCRQADRHKCSRSAAQSTPPEVHVEYMPNMHEQGNRFPSASHISFSACDV